jgi:hypothetical protein
VAGAIVFILVNTQDDMHAMIDIEEDAAKH